VELYFNVLGAVVQCSEGRKQEGGDYKMPKVGNEIIPGLLEF
jgi:hypothetical protein